MKVDFLKWLMDTGYSAEDFANRKAELLAEYAEAQKVRGKGNQKRRAEVSVISKDGEVLVTLPEMDFRKKDALTAAYLWLATHAKENGISLDAEDFLRCKVEARIVSVTTEDCGHIGDALRS